MFRNAGKTLFSEHQTPTPIHVEISLLGRGVVALEAVTHHEGTNHLVKTFLKCWKRHDLTRKPGREKRC